MPSRDFVRSMLELAVILFPICILIQVVSKNLVQFIPITVITLLTWLPVSKFINKVNPFSISGGLISLATLVVILISAYLFLRNFKKKNILKVNLSIALIALASAALEITLFQLNYQNKNPSDLVRDINSFTADKQTNSGNDTSNLPNIIYIVPDRYGNLASLKQNFNFDNSSFYKSLKERSFVTNDESRSNYPFTELSLSSTLNNAYLTYSDENINESSLYPLIKNSSAFRKIKDLGYKFYNFDNWWFGSNSISYADYNFMKLNESSLSKPLDHLYKIQTPIHSILKTIFGDREALSQCELMSHYFEEIENIISSASDQPKFIFAHMLAPHEPYLFNEKGECNLDAIQFSNTDPALYSEIELWESRVDFYLQYLMFVNKKMLELFDKAKKESSRDFIFVIQSDEGPYPKCFLENVSGNYSECSHKDWETKIGIINAMYFSSIGNLDESDLVSPINNFNIIFTKLDKNDYPKKEHIFYLLYKRDQKMAFSPK